MLNNYYKVAVRNILRQKVYSFINIVGLAVGMACCIINFLVVQDTLSQDRFHENADNIYRIIQEVKHTNFFEKWAVTAGPLGPSLKKDFPDVINAARIVWPVEILMTYRDKHFEEKVVFTDGSLFEMFTFPFINGETSTAFDLPNSIVLSEKMAVKYFGNENPIGKIITVLTDDPAQNIIMEKKKHTFQVTGVMKNIPRYSTVKADVFMPLESTRDLLGRDPDSWQNTWLQTFIRLSSNTTRSGIVRKISTYLNDKPVINKDIKLNLQPLGKVVLFSNFEYDWLATKNLIAIVILLSGGAFFILIIACLNFMNLATARSGNRGREVAIRKALGAHKSDLIKQFFGESILLSFFALLVGLILAELFLPIFNDLAESQLSLDISNAALVYLGLPLIAMITGIISGSYPAFFLSSFQPIKVLKGTLQTGPKSWVFRKTLIVFQFSLTILLIVFTAAVYNQLQFMCNTELGFTSDNIVCVPIRGNMRENLASLKNEFLQHPDIVAVAASASLLSRGWRYSSPTWTWDGKNPYEDIEIRVEMVDDDYLNTFGMEIVEGRNFSSDYSTDSTEAVIVNEKAVQVMGLGSAVGSILKDEGKIYKIIGVVKNYHLRSLREDIDPLVLINRPDYTFFLSIRLKSGRVPQAIPYIEKIWKKHAISYPFEYDLLDEKLDDIYKIEQIIGTVFRYSSILAIFVSCLGLFGLVSFMAEKRTKEVGIRKSLGASVTNIVLLFFKDFTKCVFIANIIGLPAAYAFVNVWMNDYTYRASIPIWIFIMAAILTIAIALLTVSYQALKAARANPVEALRYE
jgi:ABC-type antimicrobial peptide transport system permease subunit